ncbi:hypothetical protein [Sphingobacterium endophyticum]|uniref:hypothetical protein n=1 Tax=Sphingobacterium endophyticum TaxID=2546448 RepID=UPI0012E2E797|nr:hypothetical protein [Sphingobacterium endophyticum]
MEGNCIFKLRPSVLLTLLFVSVQSWAQDKGLDINVDIDKGDEGMFAKPWVWIVGGAVFILLLVALLRGGGKK